MRITSPGQRGRLVAVAAAAAVVAPLAVGVSAQAAPTLDSGEKKLYIVHLDDNPLAGYTGGVRGITATKPGQGEKVDVASNAADAYTAYLTSRHNAALQAVGLSARAKQYDYTVTFNGFAAEMSQTQAAQIAKAPGVVNVWEDEIRELDTITTPDYLGLTGEDGVWKTQFGGPEGAGAGMVVGVIDTGIWPENPSFAPLPEDVEPPASFTGPCETGADPDPENNIECNNKLIGARYYYAENAANADEDEFISPRDFDGHGSHTAGTAAGNFGVPADIYGNFVGEVSGMAPAAHIAAYKACWPGCSTAGLVKAIDDATADGVDVINYSISGSREFIVDPVEISFLFAASANVFVSTSAGNSGASIGESSVAHNAPWTTTVAASTHDRNVNKFVRVGSDRVERIWGEDRFETAAEIARRHPGPADTVYVATGRDFPDALSASSTPGQGAGSTTSTPDSLDPDSSPVLLTLVDELPEATLAALQELDPAAVVVVGGPAAVSEAVEEEIAAETGAAVRRVGGDDRYETSAELAKEFGTADHVYVATGTTFPDALAGGALAGSEGAPVLLTRPDEVPEALATALEELGTTRITVLGGERAVSQDVYDELEADARIFGADRYETSVAIAEQFGYEGDAPGAYVATGANYPDALAGSALAGVQGVPLLLTEPGDVPDSVMDQLVAMDPAVVSILGGEEAVSAAPEDELREAFPGDTATYDGVGVGEAVGPAPLTYAGDAALEGVTAQAASECWLDADRDASNGVQPTLDPGVVAGTIVICDRGTVARVDKSAAVERADGVGMILANLIEGDSVNADYHAVPSIHVDAAAGAAIKEYEATDPAPTAFISADGQGEVVAPQMAGFSSYGPALAGDGDLLKPDITAPGVDVIAAVAPPGNGGEDFFSYSGTSMSAPHITGLAALMAQENPDWSVAAIKSAMMTTATPLNNIGEPIERNGEDATALDYGAGEVEPGDAYGVGLVYDAGLLDWLKYACSINQLQLITAPSICSGLVMDPSDLNYPSIAIGDLTGRQTVTRTVTNVSDTTTSYVAEVEAPPGVTTVVEPSSFTVAPGDTATFEVTFTRTDAPLEEYTFGSITWVGGGHEVRSPIAVQPVGIAAPEEISGTGVSGSQDVEVTPGFTGVLTTDVDGLVPSEVQVQDVSAGDGIADAIYEYTIPVDTKTARFATYDSEVGADTDVDMYLFTAEGRFVAQSAGGTSEEEITLEAPAAGDYLLAIDLFSGPDPLTVPVHGFFVDEADAGNLTVTPSSTPVEIAEPVTLNVAWDGLAAGSRYLGAVNYSDGTEQVGRTLVAIVTE